MYRIIEINGGTQLFPVLCPKVLALENPWEIALTQGTFFIFPREALCPILLKDKELEIVDKEGSSQGDFVAVKP